MIPALNFIYEVTLLAFPYMLVATFVINTLIYLLRKEKTDEK